MNIWTFANPKRFLDLSRAVLPYLWIGAACCLLAGLGWGFFFAQDDFRQGSTVKILYIHVPSALMAINAWLMMLVASLIWFIRRHPVSALAAKAAAPVGIVMTLMALVTGALWGQPIWSTWWVWDPRLTSFLVLFLFYLGYVALWDAIEDFNMAADLTAMMCLVGSVFAVLSRYASFFWPRGQHQGASLSLDAETNVDNYYFYPLLIAIAGFVLLFMALLLYRTSTEIYRQRLKARILQEVSDA